MKKFLAVLLLAGCANPNVTLHTAPLPPMQVEAVQVVNTEPAKSYQTIAEVYAWSSVPVDSRVGYERAVADLKVRAASVGATTLWVPTLEVISSPGGSRWVLGPTTDGDPENAHVARPTELMGKALLLKR